MTSQPYRNPSPPPSPTAHPLHSEDGESTAVTDDGIGDTVLSKSWALSVLVRAVGSVSDEKREKRDTCLEHNVMYSAIKKEGEGGKREGEGEGGEREGEGGVKEGEQEVGGVRSYVNEGESEMGESEADEGLDQSLEEDMCQLWDASMNKDVAVFLHQQKAVDLLLGVALRSSSLRLTEICIGVLGNMACSEQVCREGFSSPETINGVLSFLCTSDTRILYETTRLVSTCVCIDACQSLWLSEMSHNQRVKESLLFVMQSSTNDDLLTSTGILVGTLLGSDGELLKQWSDGEIVERLCDAITQTMTSAVNGACTYVQSLHHLTTIEHGVASLVQHSDVVVTVLLDFISRLISYEDYLQDRLPSLHAALSILTSLSDNTSPDSCGLSGDRAENLLQHLLQDIRNEMTEDVNRSHDPSHDQSHDTNEDSLEQISKLLTSLTHLQKT